MILLVDLHVHFWLLCSKRAHLKDSTAKKGTSTKNFCEGGGGGRCGDAFSAPCSGGPALVSFFRRTCAFSVGYKMKLR